MLTSMKSKQITFIYIRVGSSGDSGCDGRYDSLENCVKGRGSVIVIDGNGDDYDDNADGRR